MRVEVYDESGSTVFSSANRLTRFVDTFTIGTSAGSRSVGGLSTGTPQAVVLPILSASTSFMGAPSPKLTFNANAGTVSWPSTANPNISGYVVTIFVY